MSPIRHVARKPPELNVPKEHPLADLSWLILGTAGLLWILWLAGGLVVDWAAGRISLDEERKFGRQFSSEEPAKKGKADARLPFLEKLCRELAPKEMTAEQLPSVKVWDTKLPNAFAMAGGHLGFTSGLLNEAESENELAFVAAHELGHYVHRDPLRHAGRALLQFTAVMLLGMGSADQAGGMLFGGGQQALHMRYSRKAEEKADDFAARAVAARYGHLGGAMDFFKRQSKEGGSGGPDWFSSHPATLQRIQRIEQWAQAQGIAMKGKPKKLPHDWKAAPGGRQP